MKPRVGDFYVFPAHLHHCVYPFKTKGERRSFSVNCTISATYKEGIEVSKNMAELQDDLKKEK